MGSPNQQPEKMDGEEADWVDTSENESEEEEEEEGSEGGGDDGGESGTEVETDFCIHQLVCSSVENCATYEEKVEREYEELKVKEGLLLGQRRALMEKQRAMQLFRQTMAVQIKVRELERVLHWMHAAARKEAVMDAELANTLEDNRLAREYLELFGAARGKE